MTPLLVILGLIVAIPLALLATAFRPDKAAAEVEAKYAGPNSHFAKVDGLRMHFTDTGTGPPIVLLHGINANHRSFDGWVRDLSLDHRVITIDLPGHGLTGPDPSHRYSWREMAGLVAGLTAAIGLQRFVLAGNSLGGAVALELALAHPEKLSALVLIDSIGAPERGPKPPALEALSRPLLGRLFAVLTPRSVVRRVLASTYADPGKLTGAQVDTYYDLLLRAGNRRAARAVLLKGAGQGLASRIDALRVPTLVFWGARDTWVAPAKADWFAANIPGATVVRFEDLGHLPMAEDPAATAKALRAFLSRIDAGGR
jgi:pimeloyl-ACP methyl ester carboxylesterase